ALEFQRLLDILQRPGERALLAAAGALATRFGSESWSVPRQLGLARVVFAERWPPSQSSARTLGPITPRSEFFLKPKSKMYCTWCRERSTPTGCLFYANGTITPASDICRQASRGKPCRLQLPKGFDLNYPELRSRRPNPWVVSSL
uniref:CW-type domain-containing protein n=1 Tax=Macrostomum lignano TaxID=282301 RepID=A0A1I8FR92_9PLAT